MADVDIGSDTYQAFADLEFADLYLAADVARSAAWALKNDDAKGRGLVSATRTMLSLPWCAAVPDPADVQVSPIPEVTAMLAADLLAKPRLFADASGNSNVKSAKAGSAQVEFFSPVDGGPPIPTALWTMLLNAGLVCLGSVTDSSVNDGPIITGISDGCRAYGGRPPWDWPVAAEDCD
jgi:hypothetical protein